MIYSFVQLAGDGVTTLFPVNFPYLSKDHISVKVNGIDVPVTWLNDTQVVTGSAPASGSVVEIRRTTPILEAAVDYQDGSTLTESDLDLQTAQLLYIVQEAYDSLVSVLQFSSNGYDAMGNKIVNVADPVEDQDAATKGWVNASYNSGVDAGIAKAAAEAARDIAIAANNSAIAANTSALAANSSALSARSAAEMARDIAIAARIATELARDVTLSSETVVVDAFNAIADIRDYILNNYGRITVATVGPTGGVNGDVWYWVGP